MSTVIATQGDARTRAFVEAEGQLLRHHGVQPTQLRLCLTDPPLTVRALAFGEGPSVLLVHGGGGHASLWASLAQALPGFTLIAVDRPGCGLSQGFDYRGADLRAHAVAFVASVLDELGLKRAPIIANSMGATWSLWLALDRPERVERMVLLGCPAFMLGTSGPMPFRLLAVRGLGSAMMALEPAGVGQARRMFARLGHPDGPSELFEDYAASERLPTFKTGWLSLLQRTMRLRGGRPGVAIGADDLRRIPHPVLSIWGDRDPFGTPAVGQRMVDALPRATLQTVTAGHLPWLDEPQACAALVSSFLE